MRKSARGEPISAWLADAARCKLRAEGLLAAVSDWEAEHGALNEAELKAVAGQHRKRRKPHSKKSA